MRNITMRPLLIMLLSCALAGMPLAQSQAQVEPPETVFVELNVKTDSDVNPINVKSQGETDLLILGSALVDVTTIDLESLVLEDAEVTGCLPVDLNADGFADLLCVVQTHDMGVLCGEDEVLLTGALLDGTPLEGSDHIKTVGCKKPKKSKPPKPPKVDEPDEPEVPAPQ